MPPSTPPPLRHIRAGVSIAEGRYQLRQRLGVGGNGVVWLAEHLAMGSQVVVKFPLHGANEANITAAQLDQEKKHLVAISNHHPHIVNILDVGIADGQQFIVMQYMQNGSLEPYCGSGNHLTKPWPEWLLQIASALDFMHQQGIVHRDVKPANVLLDASISAYLSDFGTAVDAPDDAKWVGQPVVGSLPYLAPEVLEGERPSPTSDLFALAVSAYEFLVGVPPVQADSASGIREGFHSLHEAWRQTGQAPPLDQRAAPVIMQALSSKPTDRFSNCEEFARKLTRLAPSGSLLSGPPRSQCRPSIELGQTGHTSTGKTTKKPLPPIPQTTEEKPEKKPPKLRADRFWK